MILSENGMAILFTPLLRNDSCPACAADHKPHYNELQWGGTGDQEHQIAKVTPLISLQFMLLSTEFLAVFVHLQLSKYFFGLCSQCHVGQPSRAGT